MRILLINPPYHAVTSLYGVGEQLPLGLLSIGGALIDDGHAVTLLDAEVHHLSIPETVERAALRAPELIMTGHAGSTPAHPVTMAMCRALKARLPHVPIVYGGIFPTYHGEEVLAAEHAIDVIVRGEGERTVVLLTRALAENSGLSSIPGLFHRERGHVRATPPVQMIDDLDRCRVGWELVEDWDLYQCWGVGRSAVIQLSRGCPHQCTYCGQRGYWTKWRYRTPEKVATEIAWLHREKGVNFVDLADENPTSSKRIFERFLRALIAENVPVKLFATVRAPDIVRDADILHLYKQAGFECFLMGMETTDPQTMRNIRKGSTTRKDLEAVRLLRRHGILSMVGHVVGFEQERLRDYWNALRQLLLYDPDLINAMYVTPHRWTPFYRENIDRAIVQEDRSKWDYRHQVLGTRYLKPWQILLLVKIMEFIVQTRPRAVARLLAYRDRAQRRAYRWCVRNAAGVWRDEIHDFLFRSAHQRGLGSLRKFWGEPMTREAPLSPRGRETTPFHRATTPWSFRDASVSEQARNP
jgi:anaerobic magnesium-protoporphyrin IX monomethyl ester cyclase